jgi:hypothetical protein
MQPVRKDVFVVTGAVFMRLLRLRLSTLHAGRDKHCRQPAQGEVLIVIALVMRCLRLRLSTSHAGREMHRTQPVAGADAFVIVVVVRWLRLRSCTVQASARFTLCSRSSCDGCG